MAHSSTARELASNGAVVFVPDHHDGTNFYVELDQEGQGKEFDNSKAHYNEEWRIECQNQRVNEIKNLIDEIQDMSFIEKAGFKENSFKSLDMSKLAIGGHSMGAGTAVLAASRDSRIRAVLTLDLWLFPFEKQIRENSLTLSVPILYLFTDTFHPYLEKAKNFKSGTLTHQFMLNNKNIAEQEYYYMKYSHHYMQSDIFPLLAFEFNLSVAIGMYQSFGLPDYSDPLNTLMQFNYRFTDFLQRSGMLQVDQERLEKVFKKESEKFVKVTDWREREVKEEYDLIPSSFKGF